MTITLLSRNVVLIRAKLARRRVEIGDRDRPSPIIAVTTSAHSRHDASTPDIRVKPTILIGNCGQILSVFENK